MPLKKISPDLHSDIKELYKTTSQGNIANKYGISRQWVNRIINNNCPKKKTKYTCPITGFKFRN